MKICKLQIEVERLIESQPVITAVYNNKITIKKCEYQYND